MEVSTTIETGSATGADTVAVALFEDGAVPADTPPAVAELVASGEARSSIRALALAHGDGKRWLIVGLGAREQLTPERARSAAAGAHGRALEISTKTLCWQVPDGFGPEVAAAITEGTVLADYRFERFRSPPSAGADGEPAAPKHLDALIVSTPADNAGAVADAAVVARAVNSARELQNRPGNDLTPTALAQYASDLAEQVAHLTVKTEGRAGLEARGMGAFAAIAQGSEQEPALITMHYEGPGASGPTLGFVGKAVTFDSGGISLKPGAKMADMKFDMSGGAAVIEAVAAIARLKLPVRIVAVVGATENLPSGKSVKPGDIVTAANGKTIEVNNTDAEGRMVLADCLFHAISEGAEVLVDLATLTGAVIIALGSTYAGLIGNEQEFSGRIIAAGERTGELLWRLPMHEEYADLLKGTYADLDNAPEGRKAGTIIGGTFLSNFVGDVPWAHLDIAGSAWDLGRAYAEKGASGYGVRLLVELARSYT